MLKWKHECDGKTALLIKGARRVGKSTIAEQFARTEYESYIVVDFADAPDELWEAVNHISDRNYFFTQLQFIYNVTLKERRSVIIFDEIQKCPAARQAIKYLVKDHRYDYIETGSLLSIKKHTQGIVIPSEETRITMCPMDYEEFRWALGDFTTVPLLGQAFSNSQSMGDAVTRKLCATSDSICLLVECLKPSTSILTLITSVLWIPSSAISLNSISMTS